MTTIAKYAVAFTAFIIPAIGWADSLSPSSFSATLAVGGSTTIHKTLTVTPDVTTAKVDVVFLFDTTGSMSPTLSAATSAASSIFSSVSGLGDVTFGVSDYKDGSHGGDPYQYHVDTGLTSSSATFSAALGTLSAGGGGDLPESGLFAVDQVATTTSWRAGSTRIVVQFGDAPSHEGIDANPTRSTVLADLNTNHVIFNAISESSGPGLDADPADGSVGGGNQASFLASSTGGSDIAAGSVSGIVSQITSALTASFAHYSTVGLDLSGVPAGVTVTSTPGYVGSFDRSITRTFGFDVTFTGTTPGDYTFNIGGLVNGGIVATEADHIIVGGSAVPEPSTYGLLGALALVGVIARRRFAKKA